MFFNIYLFVVWQEEAA